VSSLRHQFDSNSGNFNNKSYGSNVNRLRSVFVTQQQQQQQLKKQKLNNNEVEEEEQQQPRHHQSRPLIDENNHQISSSSTTSTNNNRSRSLSTPRITTKQIIIKSNEDYDKIISSPLPPSTTTSIDSTLQTNTNINNIIDSLKNNNDHLTRFQSAKALFARIEEEAKQAKQQFIIPTTPSINSTTSISNSRRSLNFNVLKSTPHRLSTQSNQFSSLPTSNLQIQPQQKQQQISPPTPSTTTTTKTGTSSVGLNIKRKKEENKENVKAIKDEPTIVNYRSLNGVVNNEKDDEDDKQQQQQHQTSPQRRSWSKLQPHSPSSRHSLPTSTSSQSSSSSNSPSHRNKQIEQQSNSIEDILNQISSSKLLTNNSNASTPILSSPSTSNNTPTNKQINEEYPITSTTPHTIESPPNGDTKKSPATPPSTPIIANSLKINVLDSNENLIESDIGGRKLFDDDELIIKM
jgi:hypothetical protein